MARTGNNNIWLGALMLGLLFTYYGLGGEPAAAEHPRHQTNDLQNLTQNWDKSLPIGSRFTILPAFNYQAVRDNNTGLVWEQAPDGSTLRSWEAALDYCLNKGVGAPSFSPGWRLPSVVELNSIRDYSLGPPYVPSLFTGVQPNTYWSATTVASNPDSAWEVRFSNGLVSRSSKGNNLLAWCVRGPMNTDAY